MGYFYHHLRQGGIDWSQLVSQLTIILARVLNAVLDREALVKLLCLERELVIRGHFSDFCTSKSESLSLHACLTSQQKRSWKKQTYRLEAY